MSDTLSIEQRQVMLQQLANTGNPEFGGIPISGESNMPGEAAYAKIKEYDAQKIAAAGNSEKAVDEALKERFVDSYNAQHGRDAKFTPLSKDMGFDDPKLLAAMNESKRENSESLAAAAAANHLMVEDRKNGRIYDDQSNDIPSLSAAQRKELIQEGQIAINEKLRAQNAPADQLLNENGTLDKKTVVAFKLVNNEYNAENHPEWAKDPKAILAELNPPSAPEAHTKPAASRTSSAPAHDAGIASFVRDVEVDGHTAHKDRGLAGQEVIAALKSTGADVSKLEENLAEKGGRGVVDDAVMKEFIQQNGGKQAILAALNKGPADNAPDAPVVAAAEAPPSQGSKDPTFGDVVTQFDKDRKMQSIDPDVLARLASEAQIIKEVTNGKTVSVDEMKQALQGIVQGGQDVSAASVPHSSPAVAKTSEQISRI